MMEVFLVPSGETRYELYCELGPSSQSQRTGVTGRMRRRFREVLAADQAERHARRAARHAGANDRSDGWMARVRSGDGARDGGMGRRAASPLAAASTGCRGPGVSRRPRLRPSKVNSAWHPATRRRSSSVLDGDRRSRGAGVRPAVSSSCLGPTSFPGTLPPRWLGTGWRFAVRAVGSPGSSGPPGPVGRWRRCERRVRCLRVPAVPGCGNSPSNYTSNIWPPSSSARRRTRPNNLPKGGRSQEKAGGFRQFQFLGNRWHSCRRCLRCKGNARDSARWT